MTHPLRAAAAPESGIASLFESALSLLVRGCSAVERTIERLVTPVVDEVSRTKTDLTVEIQKWSDSTKAQQRGKSGTFLDLASIKDLFFGTERERHNQELTGGTAKPVNNAQQEETRVLVIGAATVAVNTLGLIISPVFFIPGVVGLVYQLIYPTKEAYRGVVEEGRINMDGLKMVAIGFVAFSTSFTGLTIAVWSGSWMRWLVGRTESLAKQSVANVFSQQPRSVWVLADGVEVEIPFSQIEIGDTIVIRAGNTIPIDGVILRGYASIDQRVLTGEAQPVEREPGDSVLASTVVLSGQLYVEVQRSGDATLAQQISQALTDTSAYKRELRRRSEEHDNRLIPPFMVLGVGSLPFLGFSGAGAVLRSIPGLRMMVLAPITVLAYMHAASRKGILVKNGNVFERLLTVDTVVFDKTGTLTLEQPTVGHIHCFAELDEKGVLGLAAAAEQGQTHPIALAILQAAQERVLQVAVAEEPEVSVGFGIRVRVAGQSILVGSERLMSLSQIQVTGAARAAQQQAHEHGRSLIFVARDQKLLGAVEICVTIRQEARRQINALRRLGKQVIVLSGDHEAPTRSLSTELGIERYFAQVLPQEKAEVIAQLQKEGRVVCFIGDGINDSIALQRADVSISMKGATSIATTVAQVVLMSGNLERLLWLFGSADQYEDRMRVNRLAANVPSFISLTGALAFGWGFWSAILLGQVALLAGLYTVLRPPLDIEPALLTGPEEEPHAAT